MNTLRVRAGLVASTVLMSLGLTSPPSPAAAQTAVVPVPTMASRLAEVKTAKSMNYYPSDAGWSAMWTGFDAARIDQDLARIAALGADNVRVIVFPQAFGWPTPKADNTAKLRKFVSIADSHGLSVKVTLFDWWSGYNEVGNSVNWARTVLAPYVNDPRVIAVELKNEFQPGDSAAVTWVRQLIPAIRAAAPAMPLTLSVDGGIGAAGMARIKSSLAGTPLDYYDFHFYGSSERALAEIRKAQAAVAPDPVVIGETGVSSAVVSEGEQGAYLARVFRAAAEAGVGSVSPWTLNDFEDGAIPGNSSVSAMPAQYRFGLFRADGTPKFAATVVRTAWTTGTVPNSLLNLGFEAPAADSPWRPANSAAGTAVVTTDIARGGTRSVRFSNTTRTTAGLPSLVTAPITPVQPGYRWRAEAYARGTDVTGTTEIALSWFDAGGKWIGQNLSNRLPAGDSSWTKLVVEAVAPAGAASVQLHLKSGDNSGTVWFDDVAIS
ncbi:cellulase family glycosylhydrolase [Actinoplanes sp. G11-F43]|uniref:cellulase family glycosylhydrolase n=1 Tax=Actinoplanes sp. G11-F43 TaxID=3424130 RepID=UPI003D32A56B